MFPQLRKSRHALGQPGSDLSYALIPPMDARLAATLRKFGRTSAHQRPARFIEGVIQWSPACTSRSDPPYMSQFVTNAHIIRGEQEQAVDGFYSFLLHTTATHGFPEGCTIGSARPGRHAAAPLGRRPVRHDAAEHAHSRNGRCAAPVLRRTGPLVRPWQVDRCLPRTHASWAGRI